MRFISVDLEANQPTDKIIQIGAAAFDTDSKTPYKPVDTFNLYVDPEEEINWDYNLRGGLTLIELLGNNFKTNWEKSSVPKNVAFESFWKWCKEANCGKKFVQWGRADMWELMKQSKDSGVFYPSRIQEINLKRLYQFFYQPGLKLNKSPGGLEKACKEMGIDFEGRAHDALVDAINTGMISVSMYEVIRGYSDVLAILSQRGRGKELL